MTDVLAPSGYPPLAPCEDVLGLRLDVPDVRAALSEVQKETPQLVDAGSIKLRQ